MVRACGAVRQLVVLPHGEPGPMPVIRLLLTALIVLLPFAAGGQPALSQAEWIEALRGGGYVIVFRHGATTDQTNTDSMSRSNVAGERQLNEQGRAQARSIGQSMRKLKIPVGLVMTSTTQRAVDTGRRNLQPVGFLDRIVLVQDRRKGPRNRFAIFDRHAGKALKSRVHSKS